MALIYPCHVYFTIWRAMTTIIHHKKPLGLLFASLRGHMAPRKQHLNAKRTRTNTANICLNGIQYIVHIKKYYNGPYNTAIDPYEYQDFLKSI